MTTNADHYDTKHTSSAHEVEEAGTSESGERQHAQTITDCSEHEPHTKDLSPGADMHTSEQGEQAQDVFQDAPSEQTQHDPVQTIDTVRSVSPKKELPPLDTDTSSRPSSHEPATPLSSQAKTPLSPTSAISKTLVEQVAQSPTLTHGSAKSVSVPFSEWSHQQLAPQIEQKVEEEEEEEWQEMPALATHRVYDDWGKVLAKSYDEVEDESFGYGALGGAAKGYTKVHLDDDAVSQTSFDDNTAYLFKEGYVRNALDEEDEARDVISQMQTTKDLLTEGQRIAYVGVVRLSMIRMSEKQDSIERTKPTRKAVDFASESMRLWSQKMMVRVYSHMDIDPPEQVMVEQLAEHGVLPEDLTPALMQNARVTNPKQNGGGEPSSNPPAIASSSEVAIQQNGDRSSLDEVDNPPAYDQTNADDLHVGRPEDLPDTKDIDLDIRWTVLCDLFLLLIADGSYDSRSRTLLERVGAALGIEWQEICRFERRVTDALEMQEQAGKESWNEDEHLEARRKAAQKRRMIVMGLCTVGGGLVIGLSAGLMAPVIGAGLAAGFTSIGVAGTSSFLAGAGAATLIGTTGAGIGARIGINASNRRTGAVKTFEYRPLHNNKRVNLIVTVSGWMTGEVDDVRLPFSTVDPVMGDIYSIYWEPEMLQSTGQTIQILATEALTQTIQQILAATALSTLMAGLAAPIVLTKLAYLIDNPWTVSLARADAAGLILADSLIDRNLGSRPITLVGFSLGARLIFSCLRELARRGAIGIIQNVYLFGAPVVIKKDEWVRARTIVSGRFVNAFAGHDWILRYLFRATGGGIRSIAGLSMVPIPSVENVDISEQVPGHMAYRGLMPILLAEVGFEVESEEFTEIEDPDPENHQKRQRELISDIEEARRQLDEKPEKKGFLSRFTRRKPAKKEWETYDENAINKIDDTQDPETIVKENADVLFDVEAIRREALELAKQGAPLEEITSHISIKEIESTMPPMRISSINNSPMHGATLSPPVQGSDPASAFGSRENSLDIRQTRSHDEPKMAYTYANGTSVHGAASTRPSLETPTAAIEADAQARSSHETEKQYASSRPSPQSQRSAPVLARLSTEAVTPVATSSVRSPDADDREFGQEREVEMSFE